MSDIEAIRERHVSGMRTVGIAGVHEVKAELCIECLDPWPCDTAVVLAALEDRILERDHEEMVASLRQSERDAARADADRLADALDLYPRDFHARAHDRAVDWRECSQPSCAMASKAIAAHVEATR